MCHTVTQSYDWFTQMLLFFVSLFMYALRFGIIAFRLCVWVCWHGCVCVRVWDRNIYFCSSVRSYTPLDIYVLSIFHVNKRACVPSRVLFSKRTQRMHVWWWKCRRPFSLLWTNKCTSWCSVDRLAFWAVIAICVTHSFHHKQLSASAGVQFSCHDNYYLLTFLLHIRIFRELQSYFWPYLLEWL